jgi:hypothetical protein
MNPSKCPRCEGEMASGEMHGYRQHQISFGPKDAPLFSLFSNNVGVSAMMCLDCGALELWGDVEKARRVLKRDAPG